MINEIYVNKELVTNEWPKKQFKGGFQIRCIECNKLVERKWFSDDVLVCKYICKDCKLRNHNPMHVEWVYTKYLKKVQDPERRKRHSELMSGKNNPFYGKSHTDESIDKIRAANNDYNASLTLDQKMIRSNKASQREINRKKKDPTGYSEQKRKAAYASHITQFKNWKPNKIESIVENWLIEHSIPFNRSIILGFNQFDFGIKSKRILIEVDGNYWHGNPDGYNIDGSGGKRKLNNIQLGNMRRDKKKDQWVIDHGFTLIRIWETEIYNDTYTHKLEKLLCD